MEQKIWIAKANFGEYNKVMDNNNNDNDNSDKGGHVIFDNR